MRITALIALGDLTTLRRLTPTYIRAAKHQGNLFDETIVRRLALVLNLAEDNLSFAHYSLTKATWAPKHNEFHYHQWLSLQARAKKALYLRKDSGLADEFDTLRSQIQRSPHSRDQLLSINFNWLNARILLSAMPENPSEEMISNVVELTDKIGKSEYGTTIQLLLKGGISFKRGQSSMAVEYLRTAVQQCEKQHLNLLAASSRILIFEIDPESGQAENAKGIIYMLEEGVKDPKRFSHIFIPGILNKKS